MSDFMSLAKYVLGCGALVTTTFMILLALPKSRLRSFLMPIVGWGMALCCGVYVISPIDILPEALFGPLGFVDDIGAIAAGIGAARIAMKLDAE